MKNKGLLGWVAVLSPSIIVMLSLSCSAEVPKSSPAVMPPKDQEVCFSPDEPCDAKLVEFIDSAEKSIDIAIFDINLDQVVHHLLVKAKTIPVRIVVDKRQSKGNHSLVPVLIKGGANVRFGKQRGIMHHKFTLVDGKAVQIGSFNYTNHAMKANNENQVYLWSQPVVNRFKKRFEEIWSKGVPANQTESG